MTQKELYFNKLFTNNKCTHPSLNRNIQKQYNSYKHKYTSFESFLLNCANYAFFTISKFKLNGNWQDLIEGKDKKNEDILISLIIKELHWSLIRENIDAKFSTKTINGQRVNVSESFNNISLEQIEEYKDIEDKEEFEYKKSDFVKWFLNNKESILSPKQLSLLKELEEVDYASGEITVTELEKLIGTKARVLKSQYLKHIRNKAIKKWNQEQGNIKVNELEELNVLNEIIFLIESDDFLEEQNQLIANYLNENIDNIFIFNLVYNNLNTKELRTLIKFSKGYEININKVIYKISNAVYNKKTKLESIQSFNKEININKESSTHTKQVIHNIESVENDKFLKIYIDCYGNKSIK